jgi:hypothetical protein
MALLLMIFFVTLPALAQVPFPSPSLLSATSPQQATAVLGASQAERSTHLLIDAPDVVAPGPYRVTFGSQIPGTSLMVMLRTPLPPAVAKPSTPESGLVVFARRLEPGERAVAQLDLQALGQSTLGLFVFAQGRWFSAVREVKIGQAVPHE